MSLMTSHRIPPKPKWYDLVPEGTCRWCNTAVGLTRTGRQSKSRWHAKCFEEYELLFFASETRKAVWKRDLGKCALCSHQCAKKGIDVWQMDHIKPLIEANGNLDYWRLQNLQTLCQACHTAKTGREATERAKQRKLLKEKNNNDK